MWTTTNRTVSVHIPWCIQGPWLCNTSLQYPPSPSWVYMCWKGFTGCNPLVKERGIGTTLYVSRQGKPQVTGFFSSKLKHHQVTWLPCEVEEVVLTDSKPCSQGHLCQGESSNSPHMSTYLSTVSRYQVLVQHLSGSANTPVTSRNAPPCDEPRFQVCSFVSQMESKIRLPFTSHTAWKATQVECPDLHQVLAHLTQGTHPSKKLTNVKDVKPYL